MWKNLKSLFIIEEEGEQSPTNKPGSAKAKNQPAAKAATSGSPKKTKTSSAATTSSSTASPTGQITEQFTKLLLKAMDEADLPGFDYLEFKKALQNLQKMDMDEATRFTSAYTVAQSMGVTSESLFDSANHYLQVLTKEEQQFQTALAQNRKSQIGDKLEQQKGLSAQITEKEKQIKALQADIKKLDTQRERLKKSTEQATTKLRTTEANFQATLNRLKSQIEQDLKKMKEYLVK
ncbi:MAG: hypothetical protein AAFP08_07640 [Bacteroidota bacterium]